MLEHITNWMRNTENWVYHAIPFVGAFIALAREYEKAERVRTLWQHIKGFVELLAYSWVGMLMGFNLARHYGLSEQLTIVASVGCAIFSKTLIEMANVLLQAAFRKFLKKFDKSKDL